MKQYANFLLKVFVGATVLGFSPAFAQSFQSYHCADGTRFVVAFYRHDPRAFMQIDGQQVVLPRRLSLSGTRYSAADVTLKISRTGATSISHARRRATACELF